MCDRIALLLILVGLCLWAMDVLIIIRLKGIEDSIRDLAARKNNIGVEKHRLE